MSEPIVVWVLTPADLRLLALLKISAE